MMFTWNDTNTHKLEVLWSDVDLTTKMIAAQLGTTKGSVIGKAYRLGLGSKNTKSSLQGPRNARRRDVSPKRYHLPSKDTKRVSGSKYAKTDMLYIRADQCRWIEGNDRICCGKKIEKGSYCAEHRKTAIRETYNWHERQAGC